MGLAHALTGGLAMGLAQVPFMKFNSLGKLGVEFDIHGDRQCHENLGGTDCLIRSFPPGFGQHLSECQC